MSIKSCCKREFLMKNSYQKILETINIVIESDCSEAERVEMLARYIDHLFEDLHLDKVALLQGEINDLFSRYYENFDG